MGGPSWYRGVVAGGYPICSFRQFLARMCRFATIQNDTDRRQTDRRHSVSKAPLRSAKNLPHSHLARSLGVTDCEFFDESYLARKWNHEAIIWCTLHDPAFALLGTIRSCDGRTDRHVTVNKDCTMHSIARVKISSRAFVKACCTTEIRLKQNIFLFCFILGLVTTVRTAVIKQNSSVSVLTSSLVFFVLS